MSDSGADRWVLTGASGLLGGHVLARLGAVSATADRHSPWAILALTGKQPAPASPARTESIDLAQPAELHRAVDNFAPTHILHVGGMTAVSDCHRQPQHAARVNADSTRVLAELAARRAARLVYVSTDMVFDGQQAPYRETDTPRPLSVYGRTKLAAERALRGLDRAVVVRLPLMYGFPSTPRATTFAQQIDALRRRVALRLFIDEYRTPVWVRDAAAALIGITRSEIAGVLHVAGPQRLSRYELVERFARLLGVDGPLLEPVSRITVDAPEPRPADLSLSGARFAAHFAELQPGPIRAEALAAPPAPAAP